MMKRNFGKMIQIWKKKLWVANSFTVYYEFQICFFFTARHCRNCAEPNEMPTSFIRLDTPFCTDCTCLIFFVYFRENKVRIFYFFGIIVKMRRYFSQWKSFFVTIKYFSSRPPRRVLDVFLPDAEAGAVRAGTNIQRVEVGKMHDSSIIVAKQRSCYDYHGSLD